MLSLEKTIYTIEKYLLLITILLFPIILLPISPNIYVVPKIVFLSICSLSLLTLWCTRMIVAGKFEYHRGSYDIPVLFIAGAFAASTVFSGANKMDSLLLPGTTTLVIASSFLYFLVNQHQEKSKEAIGIATLASAVLFSLISFASIAGMFTNPGGLAGYVPTDKASTDVGYLAPAILLLCICVYGTHALMSFKSGINKTLAMVLTGMTVVGFILCLVQILPGRPFAQKMPSYGVTWSVAIDSLKGNPVWGVGPGNYVSAFSRFKPVDYNASDIWNLRFQTGSSQYLSLLTEVGIIGLGSFFILFLFVYRNITKKYGNESTMTLQTLPIGILLLMFVFFPASTLSIYGLFLLLALGSDTKKMGVTLVAQNNEDTQFTIGSAFSRIPVILLTLPFLVFVAWSVYKGVPIVSAENNFAQALSARRENKVQETLDLLNKSIQTNRYVDRYHIVSAQINLILANAIVANAQSQNAQLTEEQRSNVSKLIQLSIQSAKNAVVLNPQRAANWELLAGVYRSIVGVAQGADGFAVSSYRQALALDQFNPQTWILYGGVYYAKGDYDNAIKIFETAVSIKQDYPNSRFNLAYAYAQKKNYDAAIDQMTRVVSLLKPGTRDYEAATKALNDFKAQKTASAQPTEDLTTPPTVEPINPPVDLPSDAAPPEAPADETSDQNQTPQNTVTPILTPTVTPASN